MSRIWELLTNPATYDTWTDGHLERAEPPGPAKPGQVVELSSRALGRRWLVQFHVTNVDPEKHVFEFDGVLPLGITIHEHIAVVPLDPDRTRVSYG